MNPMKKIKISLLSLVILSFIFSGSNPESSGSDGLIKGFCIDFNWGEGGPNGFARPGLWADAAPKDHVKWYKDLGVNTIQTFCVSCNGYAWYQDGAVPAQPGLKYDFLTDMVQLGHEEGMKVMGYFCIGANTRWGEEHPDLSYGTPSAPHIPYTQPYLEYLEGAIRDAVQKTGIDGFMIDWIWQPTRDATDGIWLESEIKLYEELMAEPFPGEEHISEEAYNIYSNKAIDKCWSVIHKAAKESNPDCLIWLSCNKPTHPHVVHSKMFKEVDWLMNEGGDMERVEAIETMVGEQTRLLTCLAQWNKQDPNLVVPAALKSGVGLYGFTKPYENSLLPSMDRYLSLPIDRFMGDDKNIAILARVFNGFSFNYVQEKKSGAVLDEEELAVIPRPSDFHFSNGLLKLKNEILIKGNTPELDALVDYTAKTILDDTGISLAASSKRKNSSSLRLELEEMKPESNREGYTLKIDKKGIMIRASNEAGIFYGIQTIRQMILAGMNPDGDCLLPFVQIEDQPRFAWRAFMLDEARYFKGKEQVKKLLDEMALLKMNVFHWHLSDDQGWRLEIKKYPLLTEIGSKRRSTQVGPLKWKSPVQSGEIHAGFYTQEEIREIVSYASERHITVVPEIEMPGHSSAAIAAYPWLGTSGEKIEVPVVFGVGKDVYNVADPKVIQFLTDVLDEVMALFPSEVIHIGGDEVRYNHWKNSETVRSFMAEKKLETPADLQIYFTNSISRYLQSKGRRMMGWNEIMGHNLHDYQDKTDTETREELASGTIIHFWKGDIELAENAAGRGYQIVNSLHSSTYLDYDYTSISLKDAYHFDPVPEGLSTEFQDKIVGTGCQMWGEWIPTSGNMDFQVFPRIAAYAEVGWSNMENKDYSRFKASLLSLLNRWEKNHIYFAPLEFADPE